MTLFYIGVAGACLEWNMFKLDTETMRPSYNTGQLQIIFYIIARLDLVL